MTQRRITFHNARAVRRTLNMDVDWAIDTACLRLGYSSLRKEQEVAVKNFASTLYFEHDGIKQVSIPFTRHAMISVNQNGIGRFPDFTSPLSRMSSLDRARD